MHGPFLDLNPASWDPYIAAASRRRYEQAWQVARTLDARVLVFHTCFIPRANYIEGWSERMAAFFNTFLEDKPASPLVVMENVYDPDPAPLAEVARHVRHPAFGLCLDLGHAHCYSAIPLAEWIRTFGSDLKHVHIHDNHGQNDEHLAPGHGTIPYDELLPLLPGSATRTLECSSAGEIPGACELLS